MKGHIFELRRKTERFVLALLTMASLTTVIRVVTQRFSPGEALRDDPNSGCAAKETILKQRHVVLARG